MTRASILILRNFVPNAQQKNSRKDETSLLIFGLASAHADTSGRCLRGRGHGGYCLDPATLSDSGGVECGRNPNCCHDAAPRRRKCEGKDGSTCVTSRQRCAKL